MDDARRQMQQALQESLDRRDNGGPAGMVPEPARPAEHTGHTEHTEPSEPERAGERSEPPVSEWARDQLQHAFN